jgi:uncharacterized membrane protein
MYYVVAVHICCYGRFRLRITGKLIKKVGLVFFLGKDKSQDARWHVPKMVWGWSLFLLWVGSVVWVCFSLRVVPDAEKGVILIGPENMVFGSEKSFSRIKLGGDCILRKKHAVGSVRSRKTRIMPSQTTHRTSVYPRKPIVAPATQTTRRRPKQAPTQSRNKATR